MKIFDRSKILFDKTSNDFFLSEFYFIISFINTQRAAMQQVDVPKMRVQIKSDTKTKMRLVTDVKQELRKAQAYKINYSTVEKRN